MPDPTQNVQDGTLVLLPFKMQGPDGPRMLRSMPQNQNQFDFWINIFMLETSVPYMDRGTQNLYEKRFWNSSRIGTGRNFKSVG